MLGVLDEMQNLGPKFQISTKMYRNLSRKGFCRILFKQHGQNETEMTTMYLSIKRWNMQTT